MYSYFCLPVVPLSDDDDDDDDKGAPIGNSPVVGEDRLSIPRLLPHRYGVKQCIRIAVSAHSHGGFISEDSGYCTLPMTLPCMIRDYTINRSCRGAGLSSLVHGTTI